MVEVKAIASCSLASKPHRRVVDAGKRDALHPSIGDLIVTRRTPFDIMEQHGWPQPLRSHRVGEIPAVTRYYGRRHRHRKCVQVDEKRGLCRHIGGSAGTPT